MTALDIELGDSIMIDGVARRILAVDVHLKRGDGIPDGYVRLTWNGGNKTVRHDKPMKKGVLTMSHFVFVYGTLKRGMYNDRLLKTAEFIGPAVTVESYGMERRGSPRVYENAPKGYRAPIVGELYSVDDETLARLDQLEGYPGWYDRKRVRVDCGMLGVPAWLYFMPMTHASAANDLFKRPTFVKGKPQHVWGR